jgi:hypothetical protein
MKRNYNEGTWFAVPLRRNGFCIGVVARAASEKSIVLCYFFSPRRESVPKFDEVSTLKASSAILVVRAGDLGLIQRRWTVIGTAQSWNRSDWPMPIFVRREILPPFRNWRVYYSDIDPSITVKEEHEPNDRPDLPKAGLSGAGAVEVKLTMLLEDKDQTIRPKPPSSSSSQEKGGSPTSIKGGSFRVEVLQQLYTFGSNTSKPHSFDFYLYFPTETAARDAAVKVREKGFAAEVLAGADGGKWVCRARKALVPETAFLDEIDHFFQELAATFHGDFDGWESNVVKG